MLAVVVFGFLAAAAVTRPMFEGTPWAFLLPTAGVIAIVAAIIGRAWCSLYIGGRKTQEIVARGPYSVCRNPLYGFSFLAAFGVGAQTGSLLLTASAVLLTILVLHQTVRREERWLSAAFGVEYARYRQQTPRFWPRRSAWRDDPLLEIRPARFIATVLDGAVLLLALPIMGSLTLARASGLTPTWLVLP